MVFFRCLWLFVIGWAGPRVEAQDRLVLISPHWEGIKSEFTWAFAEWYHRETGRFVSLDWRDLGGGSDDLKFVLSEYRQSPGGIGIDLFFGGGIDPFIELQREGLLAPYHPSPALLAGIPSEMAGLPLYDPGGHWFGTALSSFGILANEGVVRQMKLPRVRSWRDLADGRLEGWVGSGDPRSSSANHMVYECILQAYGWDEGWKVILAIGRNVRQFDRSGSNAAKACALGNVAYSVVVDFYGFTQISETGEGRMSLVIPAAESVLNPDCIAILKGAPNAAVAARFVEFVLSEEGQSLWMAPRGHPAGPRKFAIGRMTLRPALYERFAAVTPVKTNPFRDLRPLRYDSQLGSLRWASLNALLGALMIDRPPSHRAGVRVPLSDMELNEIARGAWKDPIQRTRLQLLWQELE